MPLNHLKKCLPIETSHFVVARVIDYGLAFKWWVLCALVHRDRKIASVNKRVSIDTHKHDAELPTLAVHDKRLYEMNRNTLWIDVINREMENLKASFDVLYNGTKIIVGQNKSSSHLVFDFHMTLE